MTEQVFKRTFEASKYPKGSTARQRLNESVITSEYMPSYKYCVIGARSSNAYRTKREALEAIKNK